MNHIRYINGNNLYSSQLLFILPSKDSKLENKNFIQKINKGIGNEKTDETMNYE